MDFPTRLKNALRSAYARRCRQQQRRKFPRVEGASTRRKRAFRGSFLTPKCFARGELTVGELRHDFRQHGKKFMKLHGIGKQTYEHLQQHLLE